MSFIEDFLKNWDLKKHGWPAIIVAIIFTVHELFAPKDPSCIENNKFLQVELSKVYAEIRNTNDELMKIKEEKKQQDTLLHKYKIQDSVFRKKVVLPAKQILKEQN